MRWDELFDELEAEFEAVAREEMQAELPGLVHAEAATIALADRVRHRIGHILHLRLRNGDLKAGILQEANHVWSILAEDRRRFLIPHAAVAFAWPLAGSAPALAGVRARLTLGYALRTIADAGVPVRIHTLGGELQGQIGLVGSDYCDVHTQLETLALAWDAIICIEHSG